MPGPSSAATGHAGHRQGWKLLFLVAGASSILFVFLLITALVIDFMAPPPVHGGAATLEFIASNKASYVAEAFEGAAIRGNVKPQLRVYIFLDGINQVDNSLVFAEFYEAVLTPAGEFDFMKDDWNTIDLQGKLKTPPGKSEPFVIRQR